MTKRRPYRSPEVFFARVRVNAVEVGGVDRQAPLVGLTRSGQEA